ncbi:GumC family protein [Reinekea marinisedimentorum]|uniref:Polysaccharide chain length determinant protein (PEP-CTERM system associated) n=1 Tax=Reinekea marinisedimentorum TaxID=230495 RepID=A0A4R3I811_9GAMM|nr:GNVR domain-containing protein [Reinekea marinisedimentorum]TCS42382.1 polysaccharide chain length determinant protein (PEP-CTERM system associated) [Reinekea marinisedimentorum]
MAAKQAFYKNVHSILFAAWRHRYLLVVPALVLPVLAFLLSQVTPKRYISHTTVLIQETTKLNPFLQDFSVSTQLKERIAGLKALLHSRHMLLEVAEELGRIESPEDDHASHEVWVLSQGLAVQLIGSDMIKLSYRSSNPVEMAHVLEVVAKHFLENLLAPERSSVNASETFLADQLAIQQNSLVSAEKKLAAFKGKNSARLPNQYQFDVQQMRAAEDSLREKQTLLAGAKAKTDSLKTQLLKTNPMLSKIEENLVRLRADLSMLKTRYTGAHSRVVSLQREITQLQIERDAVLASTNQLTNLDIQQLWHLASELSLDSNAGSVRPLLVSQLESLEAASADERQLEQEIAQLEFVIADLGVKLESYAEIEQQLIELERDIQTKQTLYNDFLKRYELAKVTGALGRYEKSDRVKVIDQPFVPGTPINPSTILYVIGGLFGGLALGAGIALVLEVSNTRVYRKDELEKLTGMPVLTRLPRVSEAALQTSVAVE